MTSFFAALSSRLRRTNHRRLATLLVLALLNLVLIGGVTTGCAQLFGPQYSISQNAETALADGQQRQDKAESEQKAGSKTEAARIYTDAASYYRAVANQYAGTPTGLTAIIAEARIQADELNNLQQAYMTLRQAVRSYPPGSLKDSDLPLQVRQQYDAIVARLDEQNAKTIYYKVMDGLVRLVGGSPVIAIFLIAVLVTVLVWPFRVKMFKSSREMQRFQPELKKLQERYKDDPMQMHEKMREFQREHGINMYAGCLPALMTWPITLLMYQVILHYQFHFTSSHFLWMNPGAADASLSWPYPLAGAVARNLGEQDLILLVVYAVSMFLQMRLTPVSSADPAQVEQQKAMSMTMPVVFFFMMLQWSPAAAFVLYWLTSNLLGILQQVVIYRSLPPLEPLIIKSGAEGEGSSGDGSGASGSSAKALEANPRLVSPKNRRRK